MPIVKGKKRKTMNNQNYLILIRGLSGSGKSTLADFICEDNKDENRISIAVDDYFTNEEGYYKFKYEKLAEAHEWCLKQVESYLEEDYNIVCVHNNFTTKREAEPYIQLAYDFGFKVKIINLFDGGQSDNSLAQRCIHNVPLKSIERQRKRWRENLFSKNNDFKSKNFRY